MTRTGMARCCAALMVSAIASTTAIADEPKALAVGDSAPVFEAKTDAGEAFSSKDVVGKKPVVVFFYPAALTGG